MPHRLVPISQAAFSSQGCLVVSCRLDSIGVSANPHQAPCEQGSQGYRQDSQGHLAIADLGFVGLAHGLQRLTVRKNTAPSLASLWVRLPGAR